MQPQFSYFSHDVDARHDVKTSQLIKRVGYAGYGIYWAIIEMMNQQPDCSLPYDLKWLAWELHAPLKKVESVVKDFGLFEVDENNRFFWSRSARKRLSKRIAALTTTETKRKRGRPAKNAGTTFPQKPRTTDCQNTACVKSPRTAQIFTSSQYLVNCSKKTEKVSKNTKETPSSQSQRICQSTSGNFFDQNMNGELNQNEQIISYWNEVFAGTNRVQRGLCLSAEASFRLQKTLEAGYSLDEVKKAIDIARRDSYQWYLPAVLKEDNVQRLLTKRTNENGNNSNDFMSGKQYCDSNGTPCAPGLEFESPQYWQDFNAASTAASVPF